MNRDQPAPAHHAPTNERVRLEISGTVAKMPPCKLLAVARLSGLNQSPHRTSARGDSLCISSFRHIRLRKKVSSTWVIESWESGRA